MNTFTTTDTSLETLVKKDAGVSRWISEKVFPSYREQMEKLRSIDDQIRDWTKDLDFILKQARASLNKGNALDVVYWLSDINKRLKIVIRIGKDVADLQTEQLEKLFGEHEQELQEDYFTEPSLTAVAGIVDDIKERIGKWRIEKLYKAQLEKRKLAMQALLRLAEATVTRVNASLKTMKNARDDGNIKEYIGALTQISTTQTRFEAQFRKIYEEHFKELGQRMLEKRKEEERIRQEGEKKRQEEEKKKQEAVAPTQPMLVSPVTPQAEAVTPQIEIPELTIPGEPNLQTLKSLEPITIKEEVLPVPSEAIHTNPSEKVPSLPEMVGAEPIKEEEIEEALKGAKPKAKEEKKDKKTKKKENENFPDSPETKKSIVAKALLNVEHNKFCQELEKVAKSNKPHLMGAMLLKYSELIEDKDFEKSMQLLALVEGLI